VEREREMKKKTQKQVWEPNPIHVRGMHHPIVSGAPRPFKRRSRNRCSVFGQAPTGRGHPQASTCTHSLVAFF